MLKYLTSILLVVSIGASAQRQISATKPAHYALDSFQMATVKLKSGQTNSQRMNYNLLTKEMIFQDKNGKFLALSNPAQVDTVSFGERKFIPEEKSFVEYLGGTTNPLFVEYTCTVKSPGVNTGYTTSNTAAATSYSALLNNGAAYELKLPDDYQVIPSKSFFIRKDGKMQKFSNESQFTRIFSDKKEKIKEWTANHKTNFSKEADLAALVQQLQ